MLRVRLVAAACIIGPILFLIYLDDQHNGGYPGLWLAPLAILSSQLACAEVVAMMRVRGLPVHSGITHLSAFLVVAISSLPMCWRDYPVDCILGKPGWTLLAFSISFCVLAAEEMRRFRVPDQAISRFAHSLFVVCYTGLLMSFFVQLRMLSPSRRGLIAMVSLMVVVKLSDAGAYFAGRTLGKHKMSPVLSPKKTWEGAIGGFLAATAGAAFIFYLICPWFMEGDSPDVSLLACCLYGITLTAAGMMGDLFESLIKRDSEQKDSSVWLPGLGGMLDVLDSVLAAAPVAFAWWVSGLLDAANSP